MSLGRAVQPAMRRALSAASRKLSSQHVMGESGAGMVQATLSGDGRLVKLHVNPMLGKEGPKAIEDLVAAAVNRAHDRLRETTRHEVLKQLPPGVDPSMVLRAMP